jgi:hypothetical protein
MVKLRFRIIKKTYKGKVYRSEEYATNFPIDVHEVLRFLANRQVEFTAKREGDTVYITMNEKKQP